MGETDEESSRYSQLARSRCILFLEVLCLTLVGLISAVLPEAASTAMKLKWLILLESLPPVLVQYISRPKDYLGLHRAAGIWVCNTLVLMVAYFIDKMYLRRDISGSDTLIKFVADHPNSSILAFPAVFAMTGIFGVIFMLIFGLCACMKHNVLQRIDSPGLKLLIMLGLVFSTFFFLPALPFKLRLPFKDLVLTLFNLFRPAQLMICSFLITFVMTLPISGTKRALRIFVATTGFVYGELCLCSAIQIRKFEFIFAGVTAIFWDFAVALLIFFQKSLIRQDESTTGDYEMTSSN